VDEYNTLPTAAAAPASALTPAPPLRAAAATAAASAASAASAAAVGDIEVDSALRAVSGGGHGRPILLHLLLLLTEGSLRASIRTEIRERLTLREHAQTLARRRRRIMHSTEFGARLTLMVNTPSDARRRRRRFNVGRLFVTYLEGECSERRTKDEHEIQLRSSAGYQ
jgi:hypothetical protein